LKIRIKIKHLVLGVLSMILFVFVAYVLTPRVGLLIAEKQIEQGHAEGKDKVINLIHKESSNNRKWKLIEKYVIEPRTTELSHRFDVFISPGFTSTGGNADRKLRFTQDERIPLLNQYVLGAPAGEAMMFAAIELSEHHSMNGDIAGAADVLETAVQKFENTINGYTPEPVLYAYQYELTLELASLYDRLDQPDQAALQYERLAYVHFGDRDDIHNKALLYHSEMLLRRGNPKAAKDVLNRMSEGSRGNYSNSDISNRANQLNGRLSGILDGEPLSTVSGTLRNREGEVIPFAGVFLRKKNDLNHSLLLSEPYQMLTDANGWYHFVGVEPGRYQLGIGLNYEQIDGRTWPVESEDWVEVAPESKQRIDVTLQPLIQLTTPVNNDEIRDDMIYFEWEAIPEAAYYKLNIGIEFGSGSMMTAMDDHIAGNSLRVAVQDLYDLRIGLSYEDPYDWMTVSPESVLGYSNPEAPYFWLVDAYKEDGTKLTSSSGYRLNERTMGYLPYFLLKGRELTPEDRLVRERKYDEALAAYSDNVGSNPEDIHSLRMKLRLLQIKDQLSEDAENTSSEETLATLQEMIERHPAPTYLLDLADYFYNNEDWDGYNQAFDQYLSVRSECEDHSYTDSLHATALMKQGRLQESERWFEQVMRKDKSHRFIGNYLAVHMLRNGTLENTLQLARKYPERMISSTTDWTVLAERMLIESKGNPGYTEKLKEKLQWVVDGDQDVIQRWIPEQGFKEIKPFLRALLNVS
jgi:tetratricopeptide (TPR) repeat protein